MGYTDEDEMALLRWSRLLTSKWWKYGFDSVSIDAEEFKIDIKACDGSSVRLYEAVLKSRPACPDTQRYVAYYIKLRDEEKWSCEKLVDQIKLRIDDYAGIASYIIHLLCALCIGSGQSEYMVAWEYLAKYEDCRDELHEYLNSFAFLDSQGAPCTLLQKVLESDLTNGRLIEFILRESGPYAPKNVLGAKLTVYPMTHADYMYRFLQTHDCLDKIDRELLQKVIDIYDAFEHSFLKTVIEHSLYLNGQWPTNRTCELVAVNGLMKRDLFCGDCPTEKQVSIGLKRSKYMNDPSSTEKFNAFIRERWDL